jgi:hypothetical protein
VCNSSITIEQATCKATGSVQTTRLHADHRPHTAHPYAYRQPSKDSIRKLTGYTKR